MKKPFLCLLIGIVYLAMACEKEFIPEVANEPDEIVVEGYIEAGPDALPPYVLLTRTLPFFTAISRDELNEIFLHDAEVVVTTDEGAVPLTEVCWSELDQNQRQLLQQVIGQFAVIDDSIDFEFCLYIDLSFQLRGEIGKRYDLSVTMPDGKQLSASTSIPRHIPLDTLFFKVPVGEVPDTLKELRTFIEDTPGEGDFYRYFTATNDGSFLAPLGSVADDLLFDGQSFEFPLPKAEPFDADLDELAGLYTIGDTTHIKWTNIDEPHFRFWNTLEFNTFNQGPFSNYTRIQTNIQGGLGIWGGYSFSVYTIVVE
ncbi:MAG: DUF4249 domain-containing protein [Bacteroidota bacterium]